MYLPEHDCIDGTCPYCGQVLIMPAHHCQKCEMNHAPHYQRIADLERQLAVLNTQLIEKCEQLDDSLQRYQEAEEALAELRDAVRETLVEIDCEFDGQFASYPAYRLLPEEHYNKLTALLLGKGKDSTE